MKHRGHPLSSAAHPVVPGRQAQVACGIEQALQRRLAPVSCVGNPAGPARRAVYYPAKQQALFRGDSSDLSSDRLLPFVLLLFTARQLSMTPLPEHRESDSRPAPKKASWLQVAWIVVSGLFMIGRNRDFGPDAPKISPAQLIVVAVIGAALLIGGLILLASSIAP
jgi:hypothetical protein